MELPRLRRAKKLTKERERELTLKLRDGAEGGCGLEGDMAALALGLVANVADRRSAVDGGTWCAVAGGFFR